MRFGIQTWVVGALALLLGLQALVVGGVAWVASASTADALQINLAGRQRMLSQRMAKEFGEHLASDTAEAAGDALERLGKTVGLFDRTLEALINGGTTSGAGGNEVVLPPAQGEAVEALNTGLTRWGTVKAALDPVIGGTASDEELANGWAIVSENNVPLLKEMNAGTVAFQRGSDARKSQLTTIAMGSLVVSIGAFAFAFIAVRVVVIGGIQRVSKALLEITEGRRTVDAPLAEKSGCREVFDLSHSANALLSTTGGMLRHLASHGMETKQSVDDCNSRSDDARRELDERLSDAERISAAATESAASAEQVSSTVTLACSSNDEACAVLNSASESLETSIDALTNVTNSIEGVANKVQGLSEDIASISSIVETVNDIAEQTNLLALNAAIEAARAGEHGRGFAVVADEVRKLADRTQLSTEEITNAISGVRASAGVAAGELTEMTRSVCERATEAKAAAGQLGEARTLSEGVRGSFEQIAAAAGEQAAASAEVGQGIGTITEALQSIDRSFSDASTSLAQLSKSSVDFEQFVTASNLRIDDKRGVA
ncbi:MAG: methyl-accepting chemotaxis protein [Planctomycetota bacterium]